jgi:hypothetical protein
MLEGRCCYHRSLSLSLSLSLSASLSLSLSISYSLPASILVFVVQPSRKIAGAATLQYQDEIVNRHLALQLPITATIYL